jgi:sulfur relay protein TusB/DsrH
MVKKMKTLIFQKKYDPDFLPLTEMLKKKEEVNVILFQDAIYLAVKNAEHSKTIKNAIEKGVKFYLLKKDAEKRGILNNLISNLELINYDKFIDLLFLKDQRVINL